MLDLKDREIFNKCFVKAHKKNELEGVKLREYLNGIQTKRRLKKSVLNNEIFEANRIAYTLKNASADIRRKQKKNPTDNINTETSNTEQNVQQQLKREQYNWKMSGTVLCRSTPMSICGHKISADDIKPQLYLWSQETSTHLPAQTAFYGYGREVTEVKLLGQDVYAGNHSRDTQSAGPRLHACQSPYMTSIPKCINSVIRESPRTRETRRSINLAGTKSFAKIYDSKADYKTSLEDNHAEIRSASEPPRGSIGSLPDITIGGPCRSTLWRGDPKAIKSVRRPRRKLTEMSPRTDDIRKCYRDMVQRNGCSKNCQDFTTPQLERSCTVPVLFSNKGPGATSDGQSHTKSAFGLSMQTEISRNVLGKPALPAAFRKTSNTFLKHYSGPIMEETAPMLVNTPDLPSIPVT